MSAPRRRSYLIGIWVAITCIAFLALGSATLRSASLLLAFGVIPPLMLLWLWNDDQPMLLGTLRPRHRP
jgi:hypothetical protein